MNKILKKSFILVLILLFSENLFSSDLSSSSLQKACNVYLKGDWKSAVTLLSDALEYPENNNPDTVYMLITAMVYSGDYKNALDECDVFLSTFNSSLYNKRVAYLKGKILYLQNEYDRAVAALGDFCHEYKDSELYPSALFYSAESLYSDVKLDAAEKLYEQIIQDFPDNEKSASAKLRLEIIALLSREEKLLYLLSQTEDEYAKAKQEYENQLKNLESVQGDDEAFSEALQKNKELEEQLKELEKEIYILEREKESQELKIKTENENDALDVKKNYAKEVKELKEKAKKIRNILDEE